MNNFNQPLSNGLVVRFLHLEGYWPLSVYKIPDALYCMIRVIDWLYEDLLKPEPMIYLHYSPVERNAEIVRRYQSGVSSSDLAKAFGISDRRIRYILRPSTRKL